MMLPSRRPSRLALLLLASLTTGCAMFGSHSGDVLTSTRNLVPVVDRAAAVAGDGPVLERRVQGPTQCLPASSWQGAMMIIALLDESADPASVLDEVAARWEGLDLERDEGDPQLPALYAVDGDDNRYAARVVVETATLHVRGDTPCLRLPTGVEGNELRQRFAAEVDPDNEQISRDLDRSLADEVAELRARG